MISPGSRIGMLGGGQLGRMFAIAARRMGYSIHVLDPLPGAPAFGLADHTVVADFGDASAVRKFAEGVDVVTYEFENIESSSLIDLPVPARPGWEVLHICQHREREKQFLKENGFPTARFAFCNSGEELASAILEIGIPCVLKTVAFGYDGKGQLKIEKKADEKEIWQTWGQGRAIVEEWVPHVCELSVLCARNPLGATACFPVPENIHTDHILDLSIVPGDFDPGVATEAKAIATEIVQTLKLEGLLAIEMFLTADGRLLVNEMAPRPHNSGHFSFDACVSSQFEQQLRAVCDLPLGSTELLSPVVMVNLLGDLWKDNQPPDWNTILRHPTAKLHLYGKEEARPKRKMGHFCVLAPTVRQALGEARQIQSLLQGGD